MTTSAKQFWLIKTEPESYSIDDLQRDRRTHWDGVRNYQARNYMRDSMKIGDLALFYHSNGEPPGVAGIAKVASKPYADPTQFEKKSKYFDEKSNSDAPRWILVDFEFVDAFEEIIPLPMLKSTPELEGMLVLKRGQRLSIMPVEKSHFDLVKKMGKIRK